jgi:hypothetical protein
MMPRPADVHTPCESSSDGGERKPANERRRRVRYVRLPPPAGRPAHVTAAPWGGTFLIVGGGIAWRRVRDEARERP